MFRVPVDAVNPTFDHTFKVSAMKYFFGSSTAERKEWLRRRQWAAETARVNQDKRARQYAAKKIAGVVATSEAGLAQRVADGKMSEQQAAHTLARIRQAAQNSTPIEQENRLDIW